jgi:hemerythrin-like domain-containing protein
MNQSMTPTQILRTEHEQISVVLAVLAHLTDLLAAGLPVDLKGLGTVLEFLHRFADGYHHSKEEEALFPALERAGLSAEGGPVGVMLAEHDESRELIEQMAAVLPQFGTSAESVPAFVASARRYVSLLRLHILKENDVLFPMAERVLGDTVELGAEFQRLGEQALPEAARKDLLLRLSQIDI